MIDVHLLRYALAAADTGSFGRAADLFRVKQSTLSKRIRHLELRLGLDLFDRSTRGVAPTQVGHRFLARARTILIELEALTADSQALAKGNAGRLRIGFQSSLAAGDLRAVLNAYRAAHPDIELEPVEAAREALLVQLDRDRLDLAIVAGEVGGTSRRSLSLWSEPLTVAMPAGHRSCGCDPLHWTDLRDTTFLVTSSDPGPLIATMIRVRLSGSNAEPKVVRQEVCRDNLLTFASGDCVAIVAGVPSVSDPGFVLRPVHDAFGPTRIDQALYWRPDNANPALRRFLSLAAQRYGRAIDALSR